MKKALVRLGLAALVLAAFGYFTSDFWERQERIYILGWRDVKGDEVTYGLPPVDRVEILRFSRQHSDVSQATDVFMNQDVVARKMVAGPEAEEIGKLWRHLPHGGDGAMCHNPPFGLRFFEGRKTVFETTICWSCANFSIEMGPFGLGTVGFAPQSRNAQELLGTLRLEMMTPEERKRFDSNLDAPPKPGDKKPSS